MTSYVIKTPSTVPILTKSEVKLHLRIEPEETVEDTLLDALIVAAQENAAVVTRRAMQPETWTAYYDDFPDYSSILCLPYPPLRSVTHVKYYDQNGVLTTLDSSLYQVDTKATPGRIALVSGEVWPTTELYKINSVEVEFIAGYDTAETPSTPPLEVPKMIIQAMLLMIGHWYKHKENVSALSLKEIPMAAETLLWPYRDLRW